MVANSISLLDDLFGGRKEIGEIRTLSVFWFDIFRGCSQSTFEEAIRDIMASETFFPVPATVRIYVDSVQRRKALDVIPSRANGQIEMEVASKEWVRDLRIKKGLIDQEGNPIRKAPTIADKFKPEFTRGGNDDELKMTGTNEILENLFDDNGLKRQG